MDVQAVRRRGQEANWPVRGLFCLVMLAPTNIAMAVERGPPPGLHEQARDAGQEQEQEQERREAERRARRDHVIRWDLPPRFIDEAAMADRAVVLEEIGRFGGTALEFAARDLKADREIALAAVRSFGGALAFVAPALKSDRQVVLAAVTQAGWAIVFADPAIRGDPEIVSAAVRQWPHVTESPALTTDRSRRFVLETRYAGRQIPANTTPRTHPLRAERRFFTLALSDASSRFSADRSFVRAAVLADGVLYCLGSPEVRADRALLITTLKSFPQAVTCTDDRFRSDREIVLLAVQKSGVLLKHVSAALQASREVVLVAVRQWGGALYFASPDLRADREIALLAIAKYELAFRAVAPELQRDRGFVLAAASRNGLVLAHAAPEFRSDREIAMAAVTSPYPYDGSVKILSTLSDELRADPQIVLAAFRSRGRWVLAHAAPSLLDDKAFVLQLVRIDGEALCHASARLKHDRELGRAAAMQHPCALFCAAQEVVDDPDVRRGLTLYCE